MRSRVRIQTPTHLTDVESPDAAVLGVTEIILQWAISSYPNTEDIGYYDYLGTIHKV